MADVKDEVPKLDDKELLAKLQEILERWPLYRIFRYSGSEHLYLPAEISLYCSNEKCRKEQRWSTSRTARPYRPRTTTVPSLPPKSGWNQVEYVCNNCSTNATRFYFFWKGNETESRFYKVGQYPPLRVEPPRRLAKKLDEINADLYRKALTSRNNAYGLGALAYLRRVVENKMNDLLDLIYQAAQDAFATDELKRIEEIKSSWRFDDKIGYAAKVLPKHLKPYDVNPLDALHDLASDGIHHRSDDDCLDVFDRCKTAFEYVFRELDVQVEDAKAYLEAMQCIGKKSAG